VVGKRWQKTGSNGVANATRGDKLRQVGPSTRALSAAQLVAVDLVATGKSGGEVGEAVGVVRQRVWAWRHYHAEFQAAVNARRREVFGQATDRLRTLLVRAIDVLATELDTTRPDPDTLKVALKVLDYGAPLLTGQLAVTGLEQRLASGGPGPAAELRREWAEKLATLEAAGDAEE
jgi:hypothetical protein